MTTLVLNLSPTTVTVTDRIVLLCLASYARPDGSRVWPAVRTIARQTSLTRASCRKNPRTARQEGPDRAAGGIPTRPVASLMGPTLPSSNDTRGTLAWPLRWMRSRSQTANPGAQLMTRTANGGSQLPTSVSPAKCEPGCVGANLTTPTANVVQGANLTTPTANGGSPDPLDPSLILTDPSQNERSGRLEKRARSAPLTRAPVEPSSNEDGSLRSALRATSRPSSPQSSGPEPEPET